MAQSLPHAIAVDMPPGSVFKDYYSELTTALDLLQSSLSAAQAAAAASPAAAEGHLRAADERLADATDLLTTLEMEAQSSASAAARARLLPHVAGQRDRLQALRGDVRATRRLVSSRLEDERRGRLLDVRRSDGDADGGGGDDDAERIRMADSVSDLEAAGKSIFDSRRTVAETESVGAAILEDLQNQRATLLRARGNLGNVDSGLHQSDSIISTMYRRAFVNRIVVYLVFAAVALAVLAIVYLRVFQSSGGAATGGAQGNNSPKSPTTTTTTTTSPNGNTTVITKTN